MLILLPIAAFWLIYECCLHFREEAGDAFVTSSLVWGIFVYLSTEFLSLFSAIHALSIFSVWMGLNLALVFFLCRAKHFLWISNRFTHCLALLKEYPLPLFIILLIGLVTGFIALTTVPNNYDSMVYHLPRVRHWIQNQSVQYYFSFLDVQNWLNPYAEYIILHFQILSGNDRYSNLVQWAAWVGCVINTGLISRSLSLTHGKALMACVLVATLPMGIVQASSTQNDLVLSFWVSCLVYLLASQGRHRPLSLALALKFAVAMALSLLTKGTSMIIIPPLFIWFCVNTFAKKNRHRSQNIPKGILLLLTLLSLTSPYFVRNWKAYAHPIGLSTEKDIFIRSLSSKFLFSNLLRNAAVQLNIERELPKRVQDATIALHRLVGADPHDPNSTWSFHSIGFHLDSGFLHEDYAPNPIHFLLMCFALLSLLAKFTQNKRDSLLSLALCLSAMLFSFCLLFKWQPWHSRFHLNFLILAAPLIARQMRISSPVLALLLMAFALPWLLYNSSRPLLGKQPIWRMTPHEQLFSNLPHLKADYTQLVREIESSHCKELGLVHFSDDWEYPLWKLLEHSGTSTYRIAGYNHEGNTLRLDYAWKDHLPCALIVFDRSRVQKAVRGLAAPFKISTFGNIALVFPSPLPLKIAERH